MKACEPATWYVYILCCADQSLYTGVTIDLDRRLDEHNHHTRLGAKYTRVRRPVSLVYSEECKNRSDACKQEYRIKSLSRKEKKRLINQQYEI